MKKLTDKAYMNFNVILTFDKEGGRNDDWQEIYDVLIPLTRSDKKYDAFTFIDRKLFPSIVKSCSKFDRKQEDLIKISTCSDWDLYERFTGNKSLPNFDHSCKWFFGLNRIDLDDWEKKLMLTYGFGTFADMSSTLDMYKQMIADYKESQTKSIFVNA
jgi:hypothetical protein